MIDWITDGLDTVVGWISDAITGVLSDFLGSICYYIVSALCQLVKIVYSFFTVFSGQQKVSYDGEKEYLINLFFGNDQINNVYWGIALIAILFLFVFTILAMTKKVFDIDGRQEKSVGSILLTAGKSLITILLLGTVMSAVLNLTNLLVSSVSSIFDNSETLFDLQSMDFTDEQYATMARIYNTIGNYSLNTAYNSRYNLNCCYNEIREDLAVLQDEQVFTFYYSDSDGKNWQTELQRLVNQRDPHYELQIDDFNEIDTILLDIMDTLKTDSSFAPISHIERTSWDDSGTDPGIDRVIFLMGTLNAAKNSRYNQNPSLTDNIRGPFYYGYRDLYDKDVFSETFYTDMSSMSYIMIALMAYFTLKSLVGCIFNCIGRIFTLLGLYIVAPPIIAVGAFDNGEKFKQWRISAVVQAFGIFGSIIPMRLVILFIPMILDEKLVLFGDSITLNLIAKALLIIGSVEASNRFSSILNGILANNAGYEAIRAGNMAGFGAQVVGKAGAVGKSVLGHTAIGAGAKYLGQKMGDYSKYTASHGGLLVGTFRGIHNLRNGTTEGQIKERQEAVSRAQLKNNEAMHGLNGDGLDEPKNNRDIPD